LEPAAPKQGQTLVVRDSGDKLGSETIRFNGKSYRFFPDTTHGGVRALVGVPADLKPGDYSMQIGGSTRSLHVGSAAFPVQRIHLPPSKDNFISSPGEEEAVKAAKETVSGTQLWTGHFVRPSAYRTSSAFGLRRMVNGRLLTDYFHSGLDYAAPLGSPIVATARGRVIIAEQKGWRLHGNMVAIDHGQGVVSFYIHMSKVLVKHGQIVDAGQVIGKVGATGRASGPHLHFSLYVNGDATSPSEWYTREI
jgi:lysostaphin